MGTTTLNRNTSLYAFATNTSFIQFADFNSSIISAEHDLLNTPTADLFIDANNKFTADLGINIISDLPRTIGEIPITSNFELLQTAPLDARTLARTEANMLSAAWWLGKSNNKPVYLYKGMVISTMDTGQVYIYTGSNLKITNDDDETNEYLKADNWSKVSGGKSEKDIISTLKYTSGNIDAPGYVLSTDTDIFGITMTDYYTLLGGHIREDEDTSNAYCYTDYNACISNANSNNVIHNFNGIYIPTKKAKNYFSESSDLLNSIILLNLNGGKITLLTIDIDNVPTGDSSISKDDIESIANKSVLNLDTSYAELCLESNISAETPTRAGIKITRDNETLSTNVAIDASTLKINANKIYPWNNTAIIAPTSNDNNKIATYNAKDDNIYWQSFDNLKSGGNSYNGIVEANANYNRYVKIATTEVYSYIKVARQTDDAQTSTIYPQVLKNNGYINFNGNVNNVYSIDGSFKININTRQKRVTVSSLNSYTEEISAPIASYELNINNYKLGTSGLNTDISQFNLPIGVKISDSPNLTKLSSSTEYNFRISWMVSLYLFVPSSSILEYYTYSEYWNNTNTDNPTSIIETGGELTFDSDKNILYANTLYDYSYDAGIINAALNYNLSVSERTDKITCIKPTYNYTVEYPAYKSDSNTAISLQDTPNIPWKYYNNNSSLGYGLIKARSLSNTNKVDFFADYDILSKLAFNNDISNIGAALIENGTTLNAISLIMYLFNDVQQKILYLNDTVIKIIDQVGLDIDTSKDTDTGVYTGTGIIDDLSNRISLIDTSFVMIDTSLIDFLKSFDQINKDIVDLSSMIATNSSDIDDVSNKNAENTSKLINNFNASWERVDASIVDLSTFFKNFRRDVADLSSLIEKNSEAIDDVSNKNAENTSKLIQTFDSSWESFDEDFIWFKHDLNSSFETFKELLDSSLNNFRNYVDSSLRVFHGTLNSSLNNFKDFFDSSLRNFRTLLDSSFNTFKRLLDISMERVNTSMLSYVNDISNQVCWVVSDFNSSLVKLSGLYDSSFSRLLGYIDSSLSDFKTVVNGSLHNFRYDLNTSLSSFHRTLNDKISLFDTSISKISTSLVVFNSSLKNYIDSSIVQLKTNDIVSINNKINDVSDNTIRSMTFEEFEKWIHNTFDQYNSSLDQTAENISIINDMVICNSSIIFDVSSTVNDVSKRVINANTELKDIKGLLNNVSSTVDKIDASVVIIKDRIGEINTSIKGAFTKIDDTSFITNTIPTLIQNYQSVINTHTSTLSSYITNINDNMNTLANTLSLTISDVSVISNTIANDSSISVSTRDTLSSSLLYRPTLTVATTRYTFTAGNATFKASNLESIDDTTLASDDTSEP